MAAPEIANYRGSRKHIIDWVCDPGFVNDLREIVAPCGGIVPDQPFHMPRCNDHREARLNSITSQLPGTPEVWQRIERWWLAHPGRGNTPNWDLLVRLDFPEGPGLLLCEAKAHGTELSRAVKSLPRKREGRDPSPASLDNHHHITRAVEEAGAALATLTPGIVVSPGAPYQLANRLAFAWKIVQSHVPVVLLYLGFLGDSSIHPSTWFRSDEDWRHCFESRYAATFPSRLIGRRLDWGPVSFWLLLHSRAVREVSPLRRPSISA